MASLTRWTWVWVNSGSWWWTGRPGVLRFMGSQRVGHDWATDLIWSDLCVTHLYSNFYTFSDFITGFKVVHISLNGHKFSWYKCRVIFIKCLCARRFLRKHISHACFNYFFGCIGSLLLQSYSPVVDHGLLIAVASLVEHGLQVWGLQWLHSMDLVAPWHVGSSWTRDWTLVPCIGRRILNYWTTRKAPHTCLYMCGVCVCVCVCVCVHTPAYVNWRTRSRKIRGFSLS